MFDPDRDDDRGPRRFYVRLLVIVGVTAATCAALIPSVTGFAAGPDHDTNCVALRDGWHADHTFTAADREVLAALPANPSAAVQADPVAMAQWRAQYQVAVRRPEVQHAISDADSWNGPAGCVSESRHRLIVSGIALGVVFGNVAIVLVVRRVRTRKNLRPQPALAGV